MKCGIWNQVKIWSSPLLGNLSNCLMNLKNSGDSTGFEPMISAKCSNQLSYEVTQLRAGLNCVTSYTKIWFINWVDSVNWPPYRDWKADVSSVSPSSERSSSSLALRHSLRRRANARNVSFSISVRWPIYIINSVDKPNFRVSLPHRRSSTVCIEINPLHSFVWLRSSVG